MESSNSSALLRVEHLSKFYRKLDGKYFEAVRDISFEIEPGVCFGLLGPNGAGKSTTIQCVSGFYPATSGTILINGVSVKDDPKRARSYLGICAQEENLDGDFNLRDQLIRHASYYRVPARVAKVRANLLLEKFGLTEKANERVDSLSGGMKRRLQVARAFVSEPKLVVLDEPTTGLDPDARRNLWEVLLDAKKQGTAILLSTHYMDEAARLCDKIGIIHEGKILDIDSPENLVSKYISREFVEEEVRPGVVWKRPANLEDVYLKVTGSKLGVAGL